MAIELEDFAALPRSVDDAGLLIGGEWRSQASGGRIPHVSPITGEAQAEVVMAGPAEIDAAVAAAKEAFPAWRALAGHSGGASCSASRS